MRRKQFLLVWGALAAANTTAAAAPSPSATASAAPDAKASVKALALMWFRDLQAGRVDRAKLTPAFSAHLPDGAIAEMSRYLQPYGDASSVDILQVRQGQDQTFYYVKLGLVRGDAVTMLIGLDGHGKVSGITFPSMGQS